MSRALLVILLLAASVARAAEPSHASWFKLSADVLANWQVIAAPGDPNRLKLVETQPVDGPIRQVMVLYPRASTAYDVAMGTVLNLFQEERGIDGHFTVVNFHRDDARGREAVKRAEAEGIELILSMGSESTAWLYDNYRGGRLPVVTLCSKDPVELKQIRDYDSGSGHNIAFTSLNMKVEAQFAYLLELKPNLRHVSVLVDSPNKSAVRTQSQPLIKRARERGIGATEIAVSDPANAANELARLVPEAVAQIRNGDPDLKQSIFWITGSTSVFKEIETINRGADRVPVLSAVPDVVKAEGAGAVMSIGVGFESNAHLAALYAVDVLTGRARVGELRVGVVSPPTSPSISAARARSASRCRLASSSGPAQSTTRFAG